MKNAVKKFIADKTASAIAREIVSDFGSVVEYKAVDAQALSKWISCCMPEDTDGLTAAYGRCDDTATLVFNQLPVPAWAADTLAAAGWFEKTPGTHMTSQQSDNSLLVGHYLSAYLAVKSIYDSKAVIQEKEPDRSYLSHHTCERIHRWLSRIGENKMKKANEKIKPRISELNKTRRRIEIAEAMMKEGLSLLREAQATITLATQFQKGPKNVPELLQHISTNKQIETIMRETIGDNWLGIRSMPAASQKRLDVCQINTDEKFLKARALLDDYVDQDEIENNKKEQALIAKENNFVGKKIPGFFPTPDKVAQMMVKYASIKEGCTILEPSCGKGDLIKHLADNTNYPENMITGIEINHDLCDFTTGRFLEYDNVEILYSDFLSWSVYGHKYDRIVMNPPFEKGGDLEHIEKAIYHLNDGGMIVSLASAGPSFSKIMDSIGSRDDLNVYYETLPEGSFSTNEAFRKTGVSVNMLVIAKLN